MANKVLEHDAYIARALSYGRGGMIRLLHTGGLKIGTVDLTTEDLAETLWTHFGKPRHAREAARDAKS